MLIYEGKKENGTRALFGTDTLPAAGDTEVLVNDETFDFTPGKYFYMAPGGIQDDKGDEVVVSWKGEQIIPPTWADAGTVNEDYDTIEELTDTTIDDKGTDDTSDDEEITVLDPVWTEETLGQQTKATIAEMAELLGYEGIDISMTKTEMITKFLAAQDKDPRKPNA